MSNSLAIKTGTGFRRAFGRGSAPRALPRQARSSTSSLSPDRQARARAPSWASSSSAVSPSTSPAISHKGQRVAAHERQWTLLQWRLPRSSRQARLQGARRPLRHHARLQQRLRALRQRPCHASRDRSQGRADSADCAAAARGSCSSSFCGAPATANMRSGGTNCAWRSIGSLSGSHWLVRRAATDLHCFAVGIEASDCIDAGELSRLYDRAERMATIRSFVGPKDLLALPKFDAGSACRSSTISSAPTASRLREFVTALVSRVNNVLIFEVGTAEESSWTEFLPELSQGHEVFVRDFLERCGLRNVRVIAESPSYHREVQCLLFVAEPRERARRSFQNPKFG